jgi:hypothetical protein
LTARNWTFRIFFGSFAEGMIRRIILMRLRFVVTLCMVAGVLVACGENKKSSKAQNDALPVMRWDHRPEAEIWTRTTLAAVIAPSSPLTEIVPADIKSYCPAYPKASKEDRAAFWSGLLSALAKHESTWKPEASGGGGRWIGLTQISPGTARGYGCEAKSTAALKDGAANLSCAVRIISATVPRDGVVSQGGRGVAADWGPFHSSAKLADMKAWTSKQSYCVK